MNKEIATYNSSQPDEYRQICELLETTLNENLQDAESKVWHGAPVWFLQDNPIVGYSVKKAGVQLMFWSGWSFDEPTFEPVGDVEKFKAAGVTYTDVSQVNAELIAQWLQKARDIQWDYKNIVKNRGVLNRLK
ncbi:hypothetical protein BGO17_04445 [Candidatus Saccharibacteria bacterium 49-20]|nr:MAG: hypothetical protein BGO17_04445 [Candidatus Saccharibacteria bacterium 49-20]